MQYRERQKELQWLTGVIAATVANNGMRSREDPMRPKDFPLPLLQVPEKRKPVNRKKAEWELRSYFSRKAHHAGVIRIKGGPPE